MKFVLLIDDSTDDLAVMQELVAECEGIETACATNQQEAFAAIQTRRPDLVVIDPHLPNDESLQFIDDLRRDYPAIPAIVVSSPGEEHAAIDALQRGAASYVPKSSLAEAFLPTLREVLSLLEEERCHSRMLRLMMRWDCDFVLENDRSLIAPLVAYLQEHAVQLGICSASDATRLGIALDEALVNALYHGNLELNSDLREDNLSEFEREAVRRAEQAPYSGRRLKVHARMTQGEAEFVIEDEGPGFDPARLPDPTDPANLERVSGRGVLLMRTFMDEVEYSERGNRVILRKRSD